MTVKRTKKGQETHDTCVLEEARKYEQLGYSVRADLPGWEKPDTIGGYIPDIQAEMQSGQTLIVEVETLLSQNSDHAAKQVDAFSAWARKSHLRQFITKTADAHP